MSGECRTMRSNLVGGKYDCLRGKWYLSPAIDGTEEQFLVCLMAPSLLAVCFDLFDNACTESLSTLFLWLMVARRGTSYQILDFRQCGGGPHKSQK